MSRFDFVLDDKEANELHKRAKEICCELECFIDSLVPCWSQGLAMENLEQTFMWITKAIRDDHANRLAEKHQDGEE